MGRDRRPHVVILECSVCSVLGGWLGREGGKGGRLMRWEGGEDGRVVGWQCGKVGR